MKPARQWAGWLICKRGAAYCSSTRAPAGARRARTTSCARRSGVRTRLLAPDDDAAALAREADADALDVAGGDGSLGAGAAVAIERDLPFACIPFGKRNHFARDVGLDPRDPLGALAAFGSGKERRVDVGRVGDRIFLNNVSFGLYASLVRRREHHRRRRDAFARLRALVLILRERQPASFVVDGTRVAARIVLAANNAYELDVFDLGARPRLDEGLLHSYVAADRLPHSWRESAGERVTIESCGGLHAAVDGEPVRLGERAELRIEHRALRILLA